MQPEDATADELEQPDAVQPIDADVDPVDVDPVATGDQPGPTKPGAWRERDANRRAQGDDDLKA